MYLSSVWACALVADQGRKLAIFSRGRKKVWFGGPCIARALWLDQSGLLCGNIGRGGGAHQDAYLIDMQLPCS